MGVYNKREMTKSTGGIFVEEKTCCHNTESCCGKTKVRTEKEYKDLMNRLSRIEGQVRGVKGMLERDAYCVDILTQVSAINAALNSFNKVLLANHIRTCVAENVRNGNDEVIDELVETMQKLMR
jgi:DNA-binding FrmR family transcriptional regulator